MAAGNGNVLCSVIVILTNCLMIGPHLSSEMYHIKVHFTTVNDDESAKNNQIVSSFPEETNNTEDVSSVSGMIPQFYPDGACL